MNIKLYICPKGEPEGAEKNWALRSLANLCGVKKMTPYKDKGLWSKAYTFTPAEGKTWIVFVDPDWMLLDMGEEPPELVLALGLAIKNALPQWDMPVIDTLMSIVKLLAAGGLENSFLEV